MEQPVRPKLQHSLFFLCRALACTCYYIDARPVIGRVPLHGEVWVPRIGEHVILECLGIGEEGWQVVEDLGYAELCFPVDLWSKPPRLDPQISRTCPPDLFAAWQSLLVAYNMDY